MLKKLLSLSAAAMVCASMYAGEMVVDYTSNWQNDGWHFYEMGYAPQVIDGILTSENPGGWYQYFVADGIATVPGTTYYVTAKIKASEDVSFNLNMGWGWGEGEQMGAQLAVTTEWNEVTVKYVDVPAKSCNLVAQPGGCTAKIEWEWIKVEHEDNAEPINWVNVLVNGDAEGDDASCFVAKVYDEAMGAAPIEIIDGGRAFVVHATERHSETWDNQFFISVPQEYAIQADKEFKVSFRYKATHPAKASTQIHKGAGNYAHWQAIGDINFTEEWKTFSKVVYPDAPMVGGYTIAFNLSEYEGANDYYFDDIEWCIIDEGGTSAVSSVEVENAPAVYYNLQGVQIANPAPGQLYIVKQGNKVSKIIR